MAGNVILYHISFPSSQLDHYINLLVCFLCLQTDYPKIFQKLSFFSNKVTYFTITFNPFLLVIKKTNGLSATTKHDYNNLFEGELCLLCLGNTHLYVIASLSNKTPLIYIFFLQKSIQKQYN